MRFAPWIAAAVMLVHALTFWSAGPSDDDFICYRYARNWIEGHGFTFNPGEDPVEGFTNPLWVMLLGAALKLGLEPTVFSRVVGILAAATAVWAVGDVWRKRRGEAAFSPALLIALLPPMAWHAVTGLGTTLLAALLALWFRAHDEERPAAGIWLALACLLRQECALFVLALVLLAPRRRLEWLLPALALLGWTSLRWFTFERLLPMPWYAKKLPLSADWVYGLRYLGVATLTSGIALFAIGASLARGGLRIGGLAVVLHTLYVVHVGGDFMALARFHVPVLPVAALVASLAVAERWPRVTTPAMLAVLLLVQWTQVPWSDRQAERSSLIVDQARRFRHLDHEGFEQRWAQIGRRLREACPDGTAICTSPIGAIGWYSELPIVDWLGLTNELTIGVEPDLEHVKVKGHQRTNPDWVLRQRPDLFVLGNGVTWPGGRIVINPWERALLEHPIFLAEYRQAQLEVPGGPPLLLWLHLDFPGFRPRD